MITPIHKIYHSALFVFLISGSFAQLSDSFSDGDFTNNPVWIGQTENFMVNAAGQLQLDATGAGESSLLSTLVASKKMSWEIDIIMDFATSGANFSEIYLLADTLDLESVQNAWFVRIGGTPDEISLFKITDGSTSIVIDGLDKTIDTDPVDLTLRVSRSSAGTWEISYDIGSGFKDAGSTADETFNEYQYFGVHAKYTSTRSDKFFFDNVSIRNGLAIDSIQLESSTSFLVFLTKDISVSQAKNISNFEINNGLSIERTSLVSPNILQVHLSPTTPIVSSDNSFSLKTSITEDVMESASFGSMPTDLFLDQTSSEVHKLHIHFNRKISLGQLSNVSRFTLSGGYGNPDSLEINSDTTSVTLYFPYLLRNLYDLTYSVNDASGLIELYDTLSFVSNERIPVGSLVINEIMADPSPAVGLPNIEYLEILNTTSYDVLVGGFKVEGGSGTFPDSILKGNSYLIVTNSSANQFKAFGKAISTGTGGLINSGEMLVLKDHQSNPIDSVEYDLSFYMDSDKDDGGYSMERAEFSNFCDGLQIWRGSFNENGGTPGKANSLTPDIDRNVPQIVSTEILSFNTLMIKFNELIDTSRIQKESFESQIAISSIHKSSRSICLKFNEKLDSGSFYNLTIKELSDCLGNESKPKNLIFGIGRQPMVNDLVITEIMYDPSPTLGTLPESEYLEIFNLSDQFIEMDSLYLKRSTKEVLIGSVSIAPKQFAVFTSPNAVNRFGDSIQVLGVDGWGSFLINAGDKLSLFNKYQEISSVSYSPSYHNSDDTDGFSLERTDFDNFCADQQIWRTSQSELGGTPGYTNSIRPVEDNEVPYVSDFVFSNDTLQVYFSESLDTSSIEKSDFQSDLTIRSIIKTKGSVQINFSESAVSGQIYSLKISDIQDCFGNTAEDSLRFGVGQSPSYNDLIITEVMFDPSPVQNGLPEQEYLEIYNRTDGLIKGKNLKLVRGKSEARVEELLIEPLSFVLLVKPGAASLFSDSVKVVEVLGWDALIEEAAIRLLVGDKLISELSYSKDFHDDENTDGFSLERTDLDNFCAEGHLWRTSQSEFGGTPGFRNSVVPISDNEPPLVSSFTFRNDTLTVHFNEPLDTSSIEKSNFLSTLSISGFVKKNKTNIQIVFSEHALLGEIHSLNISQIQDCFGNLVVENSIRFGLGKSPSLHDLVVSEVMYDPSPVQNGLPNQEYLEIYNRTDVLIEAKNLKLIRGSAQATVTELLLEPHSFVLLVHSGSTSLFPDSIRVAGVSGWDALPENAFIQLFEDSVLIDELAYSKDFQDDDKDEGGFSLERADFENFCASSDRLFKSSLSTFGGTPGYANTTDITIDKTPPRINLYGIENDTLQITFSENIDNQIITGQLFSELELASFQTEANHAYVTFDEEILSGKTYQFSLSDIADCFENTRSMDIEFFKGQSPGQNDIIISEIMADPSNPLDFFPAVEYLELYNRTDKYLQLDQLIISVNGSSKVSLPLVQLPPKEYLLISGAGEGSFSDSIFWISTESNGLLPNSEASISLLDGNNLISKIEYNSSSYQLGKNNGGYALERTDLDNFCAGATIWTSTLTRMGGTPGYANTVLPVVDDLAPLVGNVLAISGHEIQIQFSEEIDFENFGTENLKTNLTIDQMITHKTQINLFLNPSLEIGQVYQIKLNDLVDCFGNSLGSAIKEVFLGEKPNFNDLIISEIMPDAEPVVGLDAVEYVEIYNTSDKFIVTNSLTVENMNSGTKSSIGNFAIKPKSFALITQGNFLASFGDSVQVFAGLSTNLLTNAGTTLRLKNGHDILNYTYYSSNFHDTNKNEGGYSLERIALDNYCGESRIWKTTKSNIGGTPGYVNSQSLTMPDLIAPSVDFSILLDNETVRVGFSEFLHPNDLANSSFFIDGQKLEINLENSSPKQLELTSKNSFKAHTPYLLTIENIADCHRNILSTYEQTVKISQQVNFQGVVINELMFDPTDPNAEYLELHNQSNEIVNLKRWEVLKINESGKQDIQLITINDYPLNPNQYLAIGKSKEALFDSYTRLKRENTLVFNSFNGFSNSGINRLVLVSREGATIDDVQYSDENHHEQLRNTKGIALERIFAQDKNWVSASSTIGYATPGERNSQVIAQSSASQTLKIDNKLFTPNGDGDKDQCIIHFTLEQPNATATLTVYNTDGQLIKELVNNEIVGQKGYWIWNGSNQSGFPVTPGVYVLYFEYHLSSGQQNVLKETVVVGKTY